MMTRFVILARGDPDHRSHQAAVVMRQTGLPLVAKLAEALVLADRAVRLGGSNAPLAIGRLFSKTGTDLASAARATAGSFGSPEAVLTQAWGSYVALFDDGARGFRLLRDPSGAQECYYRDTSDGLVIASDLQTLERATGRERRLNWSEIARTLIEVDLRRPETALADTRELLPGQLMTVRPAATLISQCWSPWDHVRASSGPRTSDYAAGLRERITTVTHAYAASHDTVTASISGGLDSSIVALSLPARSQLTCVTLATKDPSGDERRYARLVAEAASSRYEEHFLDAGAVDLGRSQAAHLPRPIGRPFLVPMIRAFEQVITTAGATAVFNGTGGDNVFCFLQSATPAADRLMTEGVIGAAATVDDIAKLTGASFAEVALATVRRVMRRKQRRPWQRDARFVPADVAQATPGYAHPWLEKPPKARLGTEAHVVMLLRIQNYMDPWASDWRAEVVNPLLAQPIVEYCLSIPSWHWCRGGLDRAVARQAFADRLPAPIMQRTWKGGPDGFIADLVDRNRATIRAILLDGTLAAQGLIDRFAVEAGLDDRRPLAAVDAPRLLSLTDAEAWVRAQAEPPAPL